MARSLRTIPASMRHGAKQREVSESDWKAVCNDLWRQADLLLDRLSHPGPGVQRGRLCRDAGAVGLSGEFLTRFAEEIVSRGPNAPRGAIVAMHKRFLAEQDRSGGIRQEEVRHA